MNVSMLSSDPWLKLFPGTSEKLVIERLTEEETHTKEMADFLTEFKGEWFNLPNQLWPSDHLSCGLRIKSIQ